MVEDTSGMPMSPPPFPQPQTAADARTMAALAHASGLLNLLTGFGGIIAALIIWLTQKDKSPWVAFHSLQALLFQTAVIVGSLGLILVTWLPGFALSFITLGIGTLVAVPCMFVTFGVGIVIVFVGIGYSAYAGYQIYEGHEYLYPWVGEWLARRTPGGMPRP